MFEWLTETLRKWDIQYKHDDMRTGKGLPKRPSDKSPAISGLAAIYNRRLHLANNSSGDGCDMDTIGDIYLAGLWRRRLHYDLLWMVINHPQVLSLRSVNSCQFDGNNDSCPPLFSSYIGPSWSWVHDVHPGEYQNFAPLLYSCYERYEITYEISSYEYRHL